MAIRHLAILFRWFVVFTALMGVLLVLSSCGELTQGDSIELSLVLPEGADPGIFWFGVDARTLRVLPEKGEAKDLPWNPGADAEFDLKKGDRILFFGCDHVGRVLVTGEARVGEEKKVSIPLHAVLE